MVQLAQFGLQLFLGHSGGMEWRRRSLGLVVRRQGHGALSSLGRVAMQVEDCWSVVIEDIECAMLYYSCALRHDETMWVMMAMCLPPFPWQSGTMMHPCHPVFAPAWSNYQPDPASTCLLSRLCFKRPE